MKVSSRVWSMFFPLFQNICEGVENKTHPKRIITPYTQLLHNADGKTYKSNQA
jgi:hypothetical protein